MKLYIKNMACECCKVLVKETLEKSGIEVKEVQLGEAEIKDKLTDEQRKTVNQELQRAGLEIIENKNSLLLEKIKKNIIDYVHNSTEKPAVNFSAYLEEKLNYDYAYLSRFFSEMMATTIEKYLISLKIERAKELLLFDNFTLTEIAYKLHYSSVAHLSNQFKKVTGLTPSYFKQLKENRKTISSQKVAI